MTRILSLPALAGPLLLLIAGCSPSTPAPKTPTTPAPPAGKTSTPSPGSSSAATEAPAKGTPTEQPGGTPAKSEPAKVEPSKVATATPKTDQSKGEPTAPAKTEPVPGSVPDLMGRARKSLIDNNLEEAIGLLEKVLEQDPKNRNALSALIQSTQNHGIALAQTGKESQGYSLFLKSAAYMRQIIETPGGLGPQERGIRPIVLYNESCAYAKANELDKAVKSLEEAVQAGFNDLAQIDKDADMDPIRGREDFKKIRDGLEAKKKPGEGEKS